MVTTNLSAEPKSKKSLAIFLILFPIIGIILVNLAFAITTTLLIGGLGDMNNRGLVLTAANFFYGFLGLICVLGLFIAIPYGIYVLIREENLLYKRDKFTANFIVNFQSLRTLKNIILVSNFIIVILSFSVLLFIVLASLGMGLPVDLALYFPLILLLYVLSLIISSITFLIWLHRAYKNLYYFDQTTDSSPGRVIAHYFLPVINLVWPAIDMIELRRATTKNDKKAFVIVWWIFYAFTYLFYFFPTIIGNVLTILLVRKISQAQESQFLGNTVK